MDVHSGYSTVLVLGNQSCDYSSVGLILNRYIAESMISDCRMFRLCRPLSAAFCVVNNSPNNNVAMSSATVGLGFLHAAVLRKELSLHSSSAVVM